MSTHLSLTLYWEGGNRLESMQCQPSDGLRQVHCSPQSSMVQGVRGSYENRDREEKLLSPEQVARVGSIRERSFWYFVLPQSMQLGFAKRGNSENSISQGRAWQNNTKYLGNSTCSLMGRNASFILDTRGASESLWGVSQLRGNAHMLIIRWHLLNETCN